MTIDKLAAIFHEPPRPSENQDLVLALQVYQYATLALMRRMGQESVIIAAAEVAAVRMTGPQFTIDDAERICIGTKHVGS